MSFPQCLIAALELAIQLSIANLGENLTIERTGGDAQLLEVIACEKRGWIPLSERVGTPRMNAGLGCPQMSRLSNAVLRWRLSRTGKPNGRDAKQNSGTVAHSGCHVSPLVCCGVPFSGTIFPVSGSTRPGMRASIWGPILGPKGGRP